MLLDMLEANDWVVRYCLSTLYYMVMPDTVRRLRIRRARLTLDTQLAIRHRPTQQNEPPFERQENLKTVHQFWCEMPYEIRLYSGAVAASALRTNVLMSVERLLYYIANAPVHDLDSQKAYTSLKSLKETLLLCHRDASQCVLKAIRRGAVTQRDASHPSPDTFHTNFQRSKWFDSSMSCN